MTGIVRWTEVLVIGIYTYHKTGSPLLVAILAFANSIPSAFFGAFVGALAERINRKHLLLGGYGFLVMQSSLLVFLTQIGRLVLNASLAATVKL